MTREEQLVFCKKCTNRKMDFKQGILCSLTGRKADFEVECKDFNLDENVREIVSDPVELDHNELLTQASPEQLEKLRAEQNFNIGLIASVIVGLIGAGLWAVITIVTEYQIGYMALAIGAGVGFSMRIFGKGIDQKFGITGAIIALLSCVLGNVFVLIAVIGNELGMSFFEASSQIDIAALPSLLVETTDGIILLFYAIATYEGYKFSFRPVTKEEVAKI